MIPHKVKPSATLALIQHIKELRSAGKDIVSFAAGEPDFDTPPVVVESAYEWMKKGKTRYEPTQGIAPLLSAVAKDYNLRLNAKWVSSENVLVTAGAKQGIYLVLAALLGQGDDVLIPAPYWVSYPEVVHAAGGNGVYVQTQEQNEFFPTLEELELAVTKKTKALIFSSPCNPTGAMISREALQKIVDWCVTKKITLIFDELYERLSYDKKHISALELVNNNTSEFVVSINALSKTAAMTGWRLGYVVSHNQNISALSPLQGQMLTCLPGFIQMAAASGLEKAETFLPQFLESFRRRRDLALEGFSNIRGLRCFKPNGAFYLAVNVEGALKNLRIKNDLEFAEKLLKEKYVSFLGGSEMGMPGWIRISFATSDKEIVRGIQRITEFCS